jgi:hypothetical protein
MAVDATLASNLFSNGSFETGTFSSDGTFAGSPSETSANAGSSITGWTFADSGSGGSSDQWVSSSKAQDGSKFVYLSTVNTISSANACIQYNSTLNFTIGQTYQFSIYAADAGSVSTLPQLAVELALGGGGAVDLTATVAKNSAWSDTSATTIPWQKYTFNWTATKSTATMWWSASITNGAAGGSVASLVIDNGSLALASVPESSTVAAEVFVVSAAGWVAWSRRRRTAVK